MADDETRWERFLDRHERVDKVYVFYRSHLRPRAIRYDIENWRERRRWTPGTCFLEHGETPAVMIELDDYDGYTAVSMVDGHTMGGSIYHCGPEQIPWRDAMKLANKMRDETNPEGQPIDE